jgi:hypothetical protein
LNQSIKGWLVCDNAANAVTGQVDGLREYGVVNDATESMMAECLCELRSGEFGVDEDGVGSRRGSGQHRLDEAPMVSAHHSHSATGAELEPVVENGGQSLDSAL